MEFWVVLKALFSLAFVLGLMLVALWAVKYCQLHAGKIGFVKKIKHNPRLDVVEKRKLDARNTLVLIKRDNVEHLVLINGANSIVIETDISDKKGQK